MEDYNISNCEQAGYVHISEFDIKESLQILVNQEKKTHFRSEEKKQCFISTEIIQNILQKHPTTLNLLNATPNKCNFT